jgi:hypothetical protein
MQIFIITARMNQYQRICWSGIDSPLYFLVFSAFSHLENGDFRVFPVQTGVVGDDIIMGNSREKYGQQNDYDA